MMKIMRSWVPVAIVLIALAGLPQAAAARDSGWPSDTSSSADCIKKCDGQLIICWALSFGIPAAQEACAKMYSDCLDACGWKPGQVMGAVRCAPPEERVPEMWRLGAEPWFWFVPA